MKRITATLLLSLCITLVPSTAFAADKCDQSAAFDWDCEVADFTGAMSSIGKALGDLGVMFGRLVAQGFPG